MEPKGSNERGSTMPGLPPVPHHEALTHCPACDSTRVTRTGNYEFRCFRCSHNWWPVSPAVIERVRNFSPKPQAKSWTAPLTSDEASRLRVQLSMGMRAIADASKIAVKLGVSAMPWVALAEENADIYRDLIKVR